MGFLALVATTAVVALAAMNVARRSPGVEARTGDLVIALVVFHAIVIGAGYTLALLDALTAGTLAGTTLALSLLALAAVAWRDGGASACLEANRQQLRELARLAPDLWRALRYAGFPLWIGVSAALVVVAWVAFAICFSPPRGNSDALFYHEAIVAFMIQNHGLAPVDLPTGLQRINGMPRFSHMMQLWFAIFTGRTFVEMPNVIAHVLAACSVYGLSRKVGAQKSAAIAWAFLFSLTPGVLRLTDGIMVDVHAAGLVLAAAWCVVVPRWSWSTALLASLAIALVIGTKYHLVPVAAALSVVVGVRTLARWREWGAPRVLAVTLSTAGVVLVGLAAVHLRNYLLFDNPIYPAGLRIESLGIDWRAPSSLKNAWSSGKGLGADRVLSSWFSAPFTSKPWPNPGARVEDYGVAGLFLSIPLAALATILAAYSAVVHAVRERTLPPAHTRAMLAVGFVLVVGLWTFPSLVRGRYYLPLLGLTFVGAQWLWSQPARRRTGRQLAFAMQFIAVLNVVWATKFGWVTEPTRVWERLKVPAAHRDFTARSLISLSKEVGVVRAAELKEGMTVGFDDGVYVGALWNDDYSSRVVWLGRSKGKILRRADELRVDWLFLQRGGVTSLDPKQTTWERISDRVMGGRKDVRRSWLYRRRAPLNAWKE